MGASVVLAVSGTTEYIAMSEARNRRRANTFDIASRREAKCDSSVYLKREPVERRGCVGMSTRVCTSPPSALNLLLFFLFCSWRPTRRRRRLARPIRRRTAREATKEREKLLFVIRNSFSQDRCKIERRRVPPF